MAGRASDRGGAFSPWDNKAINTRNGGRSQMDQEFNTSKGGSGAGGIAADNQIAEGHKLAAQRIKEQQEWEHRTQAAAKNYIEELQGSPQVENQLENALKVLEDIESSISLAGLRPIIVSGSAGIRHYSQGRFDNGHLDRAAQMYHQNMNRLSVALGSIDAESLPAANRATLTDARTHTDTILSAMNKSGLGAELQRSIGAGVTY